MAFLPAFLRAYNIFPFQFLAAPWLCVHILTPSNEHVVSAINACFLLDQKNKDTTLENTQDEKHKETHHKLSLKRSSTTDLTSQQKETVKAKLVRHLSFTRFCE